MILVILQFSACSFDNKNLMTFLIIPAHWFNYSRLFPIKDKTTGGRDKMVQDRLICIMANPIFVWWLCYVAKTSRCPCDPLNSDQISNKVHMHLLTLFQISRQAILECLTFCLIGLVVYGLDWHQIWLSICSKSRWWDRHQGPSQYKDVVLPVYRSPC